MTIALAPIAKTTADTFVGGLDSGKTLEVSGTPWVVYELAEGNPAREAGTYGTLRKARLAIAAGQCERVQFLAGQWVIVDRGFITGRYTTEAEAVAAL